MQSRCSPSQGPAADPASRRLWTVKHSGDTTEIDLGGAVISSADPDFLDAMGDAGSRNLHILNGGLEFGAGFDPLTIDQPCTTLRLTSVRLTVSPDAVEDLQPGAILIQADERQTVILENCTFEAASDSLQLVRVTAVFARGGAQVTMNKCKFQGIWLVLLVTAGARASMTNCKVNLTTAHTLPVHGTGQHVILGINEDTYLQMTDCQLSITCAHIRDDSKTGFITLQGGCRAKLEGVTFTGQTMVGAARNAPAISMLLSHKALCVYDSLVELRGCCFVGGEVVAYGQGAQAHLEDCHVSGAFIGEPCLQGGAGAHVKARHCTIQNLCNNTSMPSYTSSCVALLTVDQKGGTADLEDCLLENMTGNGTFHAIKGNASLTRCVLRKCAASPPDCMSAQRMGAVHLSGPAAVSLDHCHVEAGHNGYAAFCMNSGSLTCKDSLLVGWGGATDRAEDNIGCPVTGSVKQGSLSLEGCTIQLHPDSTHVLDSLLMGSSVDGQVKATSCRFVGPAPGRSSGATTGVAVQHKAHGNLLEQPGSNAAGASLTLVQCVAHRGAMKMQSLSQLHIKTLRCTNCSGCKECRQPVPLVIPEGTGGSGCSAEVAAKAAALRAALYRSRESATVGKAAGGSKQSNTDANPALVECAVCHRKPGDPGVPATLKLCGGCKAVRYCSSECQKKDWKMGHKSLCGHMAQQIKEAQRPGRR